MQMFIAMNTRLFLFAALFMAAMSVQAQKFAVLDFELGSKIDSEEAEAIFHGFVTNFHPANYYKIDRNQVTDAIAALGLTDEGLSNEQLTKLGRTIEASFIVVGSMRELSGEYSVDVQAIDISTGTTIATVGDAFKKAKCRKKVGSLARKLACKIK